MFSPKENGVVRPRPARILPFGFRRQPRLQPRHAGVQLGDEALRILPAHLLHRVARVVLEMRSGSRPSPPATAPAYTPCPPARTPASASPRAAPRRRRARARSRASPSGKCRAESSGTPGARRDNVNAIHNPTRSSPQSLAHGAGKGSGKKGLEVLGFGRRHHTPRSGRRCGRLPARDLLTCRRALCFSPPRRGGQDDHLVKCGIPARLS